MKNEEDKRNWLRNIRLLYIISLSIIGFLFVFIFQSSIENISLWLYDNIRSKSSIIYVLFLAFVLIGIYMLLEQMGAIYFKWPDKKDTNKESLKSRLIYYAKEFFYNSSFKSCKQWPPIVLSILLSFLWLAIFSDYTFLQVLKICGCFMLCLPIGLFLSFLNKLATKKDIKPDQEDIKEGSIENLINDPNALIAWIQKDDPISIPEYDISKAKAIARNIYELIIQQDLKTIALVGEYGSGKSSILNMVNHYLYLDNSENSERNIVKNKADSSIKQKYVITCTVDGWGFAKGTASEHILECAVNELAKHVDVCSLKFMPEQYTAAMGSSGNIIIQTLSSIATCCKSPLEMLKRMDDLLKAVDKSLIIFLEDVDRNKTDDTFLNEIAALLNNLRKLKNISFVLAIGQKYDNQEILIKTCEHVENVPRLPNKDILKILKTFKDYCIKQCPDIINIIPKKYDRNRIELNRQPVLQDMAEKYFERNNPADTIPELMSYPRLLKHALRRTYVLWQKLKGEIDFDDLLIVNVLKTIDERIFTFIDRNISRLCALAVDEEKKHEKNIKEDLEREFVKATENAEYIIFAVRWLINSLFPGFVNRDKIDWSLRQDIKDLQHVANDNFTKYWERIKLGELNDNEYKDCKILEAIKKWNSNIEVKALNKLEMIEALALDKGIYPKFEQFKMLISKGCLQKVATKQFGITLKKYGNKASHKVCDAVGQWFTLKPEHADGHWQHWLYEEIEKALPISLLYVNDLYYHWYHPKRNPGGQLRAKIIEAAKRIYSNNPDLLSSALDPDYIWSVWHFAGLYSQKDHGGEGFKPEEWKWLGQVLIEAGKKNPSVIGAHIAALFCNINISHSNKITSYTAKFQKQRAEPIFEGNIDHLMKLLLLKDVDIEKYDAPSQAGLFCAQKVANNWFKKNNNQSKTDNDQGNK